MGADERFRPIRKELKSSMNNNLLNSPDSNFVYVKGENTLTYVKRVLDER